jgi:hypothetical protein
MPTRIAGKPSARWSVHRYIFFCVNHIDHSYFQLSVYRRTPQVVARVLGHKKALIYRAFRRFLDLLGSYVGGGGGS